MSKLNVCVTLDLDINEYALKHQIDNDFTSIFKTIYPVFKKFPSFKATWFIRLDKHIEALFGCCDYFFRRYVPEFNKIRQNNHELGWHPHCYLKKNTKWQQNIDVPSILTELSSCAPFAKSNNLKTVRMGWGFHSNEIMRFFADKGFLVDSSAIPRPRYQWEESFKDWTITPDYPYYPSIYDYRVPGKPSTPILEVPISVIPIKAPYDTGVVRRYINLAYYPNILHDPLEKWIKENSYLVTITHPYEIKSINRKHGLLAYNIDAFEKNLISIMEIADNMGKKVSFLTISELTELYIKGLKK